MSENFTSFLCKKCRSEIQASLDMIGQEAECPACGTKFIIPDSREEDGVIRHGLGDDDASNLEAMKSRTIRIELGDL
jgi:DNA-directed RNA polymerase subunit RPC12/RpoP